MTSMRPSSIMRWINTLLPQKNHLLLFVETFIQPKVNGNCIHDHMSHEALCLCGLSDTQISWKWEDKHSLFQEVLEEDSTPEVLFRQAAARLADRARFRGQLHVTLSQFPLFYYLKERKNFRCSTSDDRSISHWAEIAIGHGIDILGHGKIRWCKEGPY